VEPVLHAKVQRLEHAPKGDGDGREREKMPVKREIPPCFQGKNAVEENDVGPPDHEVKSIHERLGPAKQCAIGK
jgi:hypothetical protein